MFRTHADIARSPGNRCHGVLWEISNKDLKALDALEGFPYYYTRFRVRVNTGDSFVYALTYQMNDQSYMHEPGTGYLNMVREGYVQNSVPTGQIDQALNTICLSNESTNAVSHLTWSAMTPDCV